jgi:two-component system, cell cycle response regulator DivK
LNARKKIAIVEDNPDNRELVRYVLSEAYDVLEYDSGQHALEGVRQSRPDLILLDISLPQMDGPEILSLMRADRELAALPVIALTAHAMKGDREKYLSLGFNDYVAKPILDEGVLLRKIERWLGAKGKANENPGGR